MGRVFWAHAAVAFVNILYGINFTIAKELCPAYIQPFGFIVFRVVVSVVLFFIISPWFIKESIRKSDIPRFIFCGLTGVAINQLLFFKGLSLTSPINGAIIMCMNPILVILLAALLIREKITWVKSLGIALGFLGSVGLLFLRGEPVSFSSDSFRGDFFIFVNALSYGVYLVISKPLLTHYHPITVIKWTFLFGAIFVLPVGMPEALEARFEDLTPMLWAGVFYVVIMTTFVVYLLNTVALKTLSPSIVSTYIFLQPFLATLISLALSKAPLTASHIVSSVFIFSGVILVSRK